MDIHVCDIGVSFIGRSQFLERGGGKLQFWVKEKCGAGFSNCGLLVADGKECEKSLTV